MFTIEEMNRMVACAIDGKPYEPATPEAAAMWEAIKRDVAEMIARGQIPDLIFDV